MASIHPTEANRTAQSLPGEKSTLVDLGLVAEIIEKHGYRESSLIGILQDIQAKMNFLPRKALIQVAKSLDIPLARIYGIATFYKAFSLEPRGRHTVQVCLGTACHVRGGARILDYLETHLATKAGQTTKDLRFSLDRVNCLGACALAPIVVVDEKYHGRMRMNRVEATLKKYR
ncbi:MAG: NAD(P)H-dependent oxidoreductase subunit E [Proteobacteria bacterium]|nr:NAD(P)H-dependent oxidoreductase subunit E [Pseudomonadota bacterium]